MASLAYFNDILNDAGVEWLGQNLPAPYGGEIEEIGKTIVLYTEAIDNGKGKEVAAAIRSLKETRHHGEIAKLGRTCRAVLILCILFGMALIVFFWRSF